MKRWSGVLLTLSFICLMGRQASAAPVALPDLPDAEKIAAAQKAALAEGHPFAFLIINGSLAMDLTDSIHGVEGSKIQQLDQKIQTAEGEIHVTAIFNNDPFITFGATTTNAVAGPVTYAFLFGTPIVPGFYNVATSTGGVTVTNGASGTADVNNSVIYPTYISGYGTVGLVPTNLGVDLGTGTVTATGTPFTVATTKNFGGASNTFGATFYDNLEALLTYTQTDIGSVASWSGAVTLNANPIPEPISMALFGTGALILGAFRVVRRRTV
jgi:hypothetical protein